MLLSASAYTGFNKDRIYHAEDDDNGDDVLMDDIDESESDPVWRRILWMRRLVVSRRGIYSILTRNRGGGGHWSTRNPFRCEPVAKVPIQSSATAQESSLNDLVFRD